MVKDLVLRDTTLHKLTPSTGDLLVTLTRTGSGVFDDPAYSSTASSRGSVAILTRE